MYRYDFCTIWRGGWVNVNDGGGGAVRQIIMLIRHGDGVGTRRVQGCILLQNGFGMLNTIEREISELIANGQFTKSARYRIVKRLNRLTKLPSKETESTIICGKRQLIEYYRLCNWVRNVSSTTTLRLTCLHLYPETSTFCYVR